MSFGKENGGEFTIANISYFSEPEWNIGEWHSFCQILKVFLHQNFVPAIRYNFG